MAGTSKIRSFCVTTTASDDETSEGHPENSKRDAVDVAPSAPAPEDEAAAEPAPENEAAAEPTTMEPTTAEPARRGPVGQELDLTLDNPTDRVHFQLCTLPTAPRTTIIHHGPCRLKEPFAISSENGNIHIFSEKHYHAHSGAMEIERQWLCFSPTTKKPYFQRCWLFGYPSEMRKEWANSVSGNPKNFGVKIKSHEETQSHLDASIAFGQRKAGQRIDRIQEQTSVAEATFWRMCLLRTINIFMALAMMSLTLRGNREHVGDGDCQGGNFLALVAMQAWFDPVLQQGLLQTHPSRERVYCPIVRYQLIKTVSAVNEITQPAISFTLFGTLVICYSILGNVNVYTQGREIQV